MGRRRTKPDASEVSSFTLEGRGLGKAEVLRSNVQVTAPKRRSRKQQAGEGDRRGQQASVDPTPVEQLALVELDRSRTKTRRKVDSRGVAAGFGVGIQRCFPLPCLLDKGSNSPLDGAPVGESHAALRKLGQVEPRVDEQGSGRVSSASAARQRVRRRSDGSGFLKKDAGAIGANGASDAVRRHRESLAKNKRSGVAGISASQEESTIATLRLLGSPRMSTQEDKRDSEQEGPAPPLPPQREARELLPIGEMVTHPKRGVGTLKGILKDGRRVVRFADSAPRRYNVHSLHKLTSSETNAVQAKMLDIGWLDKVAPFAAREEGTLEAGAAEHSSLQEKRRSSLQKHVELHEGDVVRLLIENEKKKKVPAGGYPKRGKAQSVATVAAAAAAAATAEEVCPATDIPATDMSKGAVVDRSKKLQAKEADLHDDSIRVARTSLVDARTSLAEVNQDPTDKYSGPVGVVVASLPGVPKDAVGVRLEGQGRTLHYLPSQLLLLPPPPMAGVSLACLCSFREAHKELLSGLSADSVWQHMLHPLAEKCSTSLAEALMGVTIQGGGGGGSGGGGGGGGDGGDGSGAGGGAGAPLAGRANVYVSYHGGMNFESVLESLEEFEAARRDGQGGAPAGSPRDSYEASSLRSATLKATLKASSLGGNSPGNSHDGNSPCSNSGGGGGGGGGKSDSPDGVAPDKQGFFYWFLPFCEDPHLETIQAAALLTIAWRYLLWLCLLGDSLLTMAPRDDPGGSTAVD